MSTSVEQVCEQCEVAGSHAPLESAPPVLVRSPATHRLWPALETAVVMTGTIIAVRVLGTRCAPQIRWLVIPTTLVGAALIPTLIGRRAFPPFGATVGHIGPALRTLCGVCLGIFPALFLGLWLLTALHLPIPLRPVTAGQPNWLAWLLYQFLYVAVAEEVFFRGYVQTSLTRLLAQRGWREHRGSQIAIVLSAACFALAHVAIQGQITSALVFLPGLVLAWLFARTRSLFAPILFHGLANVSYGVMAALLM
jgi:membrane protease YdiL (CAAX protease family)